MPRKLLKEIQADCIFVAKATVPTIVQKGKLYKWKGNVTSFLTGELDFRHLPNFGPVLVDCSAYIPCIIVDPVRNAKKLTKLYNHTVLVSDPEFVVEVYVIDNQEHSLIHLLLNAGKLTIIEKSMRAITSALKISKNSSLCTTWNQKIIPLKISSAILTPKSEIMCFVLIVLVSNEEENKNEEELVWLILKNGDVIWKDLLIPNRIFNINIPSEIPLDYFSFRSSFYSIFDSSWDLSFPQMMHHKDLLKTSTVIFFPKHAKISTLQAPTKINTHMEKWFHISESALKSTNFASIYGIIKEIRYMESWKSFNCPWCNKFDNFFERTMQEHQLSEPESDKHAMELINEWYAPSSPDDIDESVHYFPVIPFIRSENEKISGFGIRGGKLTVQITLQTKNSSQTAYVFLKRWKVSQYPAGLIPGVTICCTDMNVKRSKKKCFYFISTPLTRILLLETFSLKIPVVCENWGQFGFPFLKCETDKFWGILDLDLLTKVSISAKCKLCNEAFVQYRCSNRFCTNNELQMNPDYTVVAVARLFVRGFNGSESSSLYMKNETVKQYLCIPDRIWQKLTELSANSELFYLCSDIDDDDTNCDIANIYFRKYCKFFRPRPRFHVYCRRFKNDEGRFFCLELSQISESRLSTFRKIINSKSVETS